MPLQIKLASTTFSSAGLPTIWTPASIASDIRLWGKADVGATTNANGRLTSLADQSGLGKTMTSPSGVRVAPYDINSPNYITNLQNSLPGFMNDTGFGLSRSLLTASNPFASTFTHLTPFSIAVAFKRNNINYLTEALFHQISAQGNFLEGWGVFLNHYYSQGNACLWIGNTWVISGSSQILVTGSTPLISGTNYVMIINYTGSGQASGVSIYINGNQDTCKIAGDSLITGTLPPQTNLPATANGGVVSATAPLSIGDSWNFGSANADTYYEFLLFDRPLTQAESYNTSSYLNQRWAIY